MDKLQEQYYGNTGVKWWKIYFETVTVFPLTNKQYEDINDLISDYIKKIDQSDLKQYNNLSDLNQTQ